MTRQLVKKNFGGKRKGYKGSGWFDLLKGHFGRHWGKYLLGEEVIRHGMGWKKGGRVRGVGKATHGYGRAMRKK
tara:strand:- start:28 stop:249 length:222 start_codon:yes stop_codon:yes gene_type:complete